VARPRRILVADDDADAAHALAELLNVEGHDAEAAVGGREAGRRLGNGAFDIAFLDTVLPGRSDIESFFALSEGREDTRYLMTGYCLGQLLHQTAKDGAQILPGRIQASTVLKAVKDAGSDGIMLLPSAEPEAGRVLHDLLVESEYAVAHVTEAAGVADALEARRVHVLILDLGSRLIEALKVYSALQAENRGKPTIILASADDNAIATGIIGKPYDPQLLLGQIDALAA
jgi:DNA-binding response OmpR family regulator